MQLQVAVLFESELESRELAKEVEWLHRKSAKGN